MHWVPTDFAKISSVTFPEPFLDFLGPSLYSNFSFTTFCDKNEKMRTFLMSEKRHEIGTGGKNVKFRDCKQNREGAKN